ncbi:hypothetical protein DMENIID0001_122990 [Sergentomyia squamirostris]
MHVLKDCTNYTQGHELVPIVTMGDGIVLPEVLDNVPQMQACSQQIMQQQAPGQLQQPGLTGVYTLPEEPELEAEENTPM